MDMNDNWKPDPNETARIAYAYYVERGYRHGSHEEDWLRAEQELCNRNRNQATRTVAGVFQHIDDAQRAYDDLVSEGFTQDQLSVIANKTGTSAWSDRMNTPGRPEHAGSQVASDAGIGAALGGVGGLLLGFAGLAVPGVGPVLAAGPIIAALGGAGIGAAAGGLIGALTEGGIPEDDASIYAEGVRRGDILVTVQTSGDRAHRASEILDRAGAVDIDDRVSNWRARGWTRHDANAQPLTGDELRRERSYYSAAQKQGKQWAAEAVNARDDAARTSTKAGKPSGAERRDIENRDATAIASERERRARVYDRI